MAPFSRHSDCSPDQRPVPTRSTLSVGDRVVFYSDGVIERRCAAGRLGAEALYRHIAATTEPSAASLLTDILKHVAALHETPLDDDATVLVLAVLDDRTHEPSASPPNEAAPVSPPDGA